MIIIMKKTLFFFVLVLWGEMINAQLNKESESLLKQQMYEDFDFFYDKLLKVDPHLAVVKIVTGDDILADIQTLRMCIDTVSCEQGFYEIMYRAMMLCKNPHDSFAGNYIYSDKDTVEIKQAEKNTLEKLKPIFDKYDRSINPFPLYYFDGEYFTNEIFDKDGISQIPAKSKLLKIDDIPIDEYIKKWVFPVHDRVKWDNLHKKFYVGDIFTPARLSQSNNFKLTYSSSVAIKEKELTSYQVEFPKYKGVSNPNIFYLEQDKILYIRVPEMKYEWIEPYKDGIAKYKNKDIKHVIIDVRKNGGGNDELWLNIVSAIIDQPISTLEKLGFKDNSLVKEYLKKSNIQYIDEELQKEPLVIEKDTLFCIQQKREIKPSENTLKFNGKIYVFVDDRCFSSTLAFASFCQHTDQLITIGTNSGYFGGQGITPFYFILPNSKLIFRVDCSIDASYVNPNSYEDYYHNMVEVPVKFDIDDMMKEYEYGGIFYNSDYLYNDDPVFKYFYKNFCIKKHLITNE